MKISRVQIEDISGDADTKVLSNRNPRDGVIGDPRDVLRGLKIRRNARKLDLV